MRTLVSIALPAMVYPIFAFVSLEPDVFSWPLEGRGFLVLTALFVGGMAYSYPGWDQRGGE